MNDYDLLREILINVLNVPDRCIEEIQKDSDGNILAMYTCTNGRLTCLGAELKDYEISYTILDWVRNIKLKENK